ncbi:serine hydrolase domain-containing protein [Nonlabens sp. Asnod3-H03]|uniref:serine hydrolase domain-containing protein n=1 Tax=Nonlabens sp. Asnod3-H03 TaxID=3160580 RepID=UPI00386CFEFB
MNYKLLVSLLILCGLSSCKNTDTSATDENIIVKAVEVELDKKLDSIHQLKQFHGIGVSIVNKKGPVFQEGYGYLDRKIRADYTENTIQNIASISKVILGLTLAKAVEDGHIKLDDDINNYLDFNVRNPQYPDDPILVRHLTSHTSSILDGDYYDLSYINLEDDAVDNPKIDQEELAYFHSQKTAPCLEAYLKEGLQTVDSTQTSYIFHQFAPGTAYSYSNIGAGLTALIIEKATKTSFKGYSKKHIIDPLGLKNTSWNVADLDSRQRSTLYSTLELRYPVYRLITFADGGLYTTPNDLGIILTELINGYNGKGTLLKTSTYVQLYKKQLNESMFKTEKSLADFQKGFNKGMFITYERDGIGHSGGDPGVSTLMYFNPKTSIGQITFLNTDFNSQEAYDSFIAIDSILKEYGNKLLKK